MLVFKPCKIGWGYPVLWGLEINDFFIIFLYSFGKTRGERKRALEFILSACAKIFKIEQVARWCGAIEAGA